jgi:3-deoxy-D-manno-octulosonic-acid transferase
VLFSEAGSKPLADYRTLIVDNMGMLSSLYGYGEFAYIGGAFRQTLHNTLEAAAHGVPVFFGNDPTNKKFREAGLLTQTGAGIPIASSEELRQLFVPLMQDEKQRKKLGSIAAEFVSSHTGATPMIVNYLQNQLQL